MGSSSSVLNKGSDREVSETDSLHQKDKQPESYGSGESLEVDSNISLMDLSKENLVAKIRDMQSKYLPEKDCPKEERPTNGLIPRSIFSDFDSNSPESLRAKDTMIHQLENDLRAQKRLLDNQKLLSKEKLAKYAAEITDLRYKSNKRIYELELEVKNQSNQGILIEKQNPLITKLSQKINEQAQIIKELESSLSRKDEIIEGFKIFEACQYNRTFETSEESQHKANDFDFAVERTSKNTRSFVSQDLVIVDSFNRPVQLSFSDETFYCTEQLQPSNYKPSKLNGHGIDKNLLLNSECVPSNNSPSGHHKSSLVKLPTDIIGPPSLKFD